MPALRGVFDRIGEQVYQDLVDAGLVTNQVFVADACDLQVEFLVFGFCHGLDDRVYRGDDIVEGKFLQVQDDLAAFDLGDVQHIVDQAQQVLAGGGDFFGVLPDLGGVFRVLGQEGGEPQHRVHRRADIVGHVGQKHGFGLVGDLGGLEGLGQLLAVDPALVLLLPAQLLLLPPAAVVQGDAEEKGRQKRSHYDHDILVDGPALLLDGLHRHIAHQEDGPAVDRPHIVQGVYIPDVVVKQRVAPLVQAGLHLRLDVRVLDAVGPIKIRQVQVARAALAHPLGLEDKALALRIHDVQRGLLVVKAVGQGLVDGVVDIFGIQRSDGLAVPLHRALYSIRPGPHIVQIGLGDRQAVYRAARGEIKPFLGEPLPVVGDAFRLSREDERHFRHSLVPLVDLDVGLRVLRPRGLLGNQHLKLRLITQDGFDGALDQVQAFAQVLDGRRGHLLGNFMRYRKYDHSKEKEN